jgi:cell division protein ZapA
VPAAVKFFLPAFGLAGLSKPLQEALGMRTPAEVYAPSARRFPEPVREAEYPVNMLVPRVGGRGHFRWKQDEVFCGIFAVALAIAPNTMPSTKVQIFGQTYSIAGDLDPAYVQKLAAYVDEKMRIISDATSTVDTQKAAVLAALAIADELHSGLRERGEQEELLREQAERCLTLVERALKQTA